MKALFFRASARASKGFVRNPMNHPAGRALYQARLQHTIQGNDDTIDEPKQKRRRKINMGKKKRQHRVKKSWSSTSVFEQEFYRAYKARASTSVHDRLRVKYPGMLANRERLLIIGQLMALPADVGEGDPQRIELTNKLFDLCTSSEAMRQVLDDDVPAGDFETAKVKMLRDSGLEHLILQLIIEGNEDGAWDVTKTLSRFNNSIKAARSWYRGRSTWLTHKDKRLVREQRMRKAAATGDFRSVRALFDKVKCISQVQLRSLNFNLMMKSCHSSEEIRELIEQEMRECGVKPHATVFSGLAAMLQIEGDREGAYEVMEKLLPNCRLKLTEDVENAFYVNAKDLAKRRVVQLGHSRQQETELGRRKVFSLFAKIKDTGMANGYHYDLMMKFCATAEEMRELIELDMLPQGVLPTINHVNEVVKQLMLEGDKWGARDLVYTLLPRVGVEENAFTQRWLDESASELRRLRAMRLTYLATTGTEFGRRAAMALLKKMAHNGCAEVVHFNPVLRLCHTSDGMRRIIEQHMPAAAAEPDTATFNLLLAQLVLEGDEEGAQHVVNFLMPTNLVSSDEDTEDIMAWQDSLMDHRRTVQLRCLLDERTPERRQRAREFLDKLAANDAATTRQFNEILRYTGSSKELLHAIDNGMAAAGAAPDMTTLGLLLEALVLEGDVEGAEHVLATRVPVESDRDAAARVDDETLRRMRVAKLDARGRRALKADGEALRRMRVAKLRGFLREGTEEGRRHAVAFFSQLQAAKLATIFSFNAIISACSTSEEIREIIDKDMSAAGVDPDEVSLNALAKQLMLEGDEIGARAVEESFAADRERTSHWSERSPEVWRGFRISHLRDLVAEKTPEAKSRAVALVEALVANSCAEVAYFNTLLGGCTSEEIREIIEKDMPAAGVKPDVHSFNALVKQLMEEGNRRGMFEVLDTLMPCARVKGDLTTRTLLAMSSSRISVVATEKKWLEMDLHRELPYVT